MVLLDGQRVHSHVLHESLLELVFSCIDLFNDLLDFFLTRIHQIYQVKLRLIRKHNAFLFDLLSFDVECLSEHS